MLHTSTGSAFSELGELTTDCGEKNQSVHENAVNKDTNTRANAWRTITQGWTEQLHWTSWG